jgi:signal transduction histidine kinase
MTDTCGICSFFLSHLTIVSFVQGLSFFVTGIVVWLEATRHSNLELADTLPFLALFGLLSGTHQWLEMFQTIRGDPAGLLGHVFRLAVLALSFIALVEFGLRLVSLSGVRCWQSTRWLLLAVFLFGTALIQFRWGPQGREAWLPAVDGWARYCLAIPGSLLAAVGLARYARRSMGDQRRLSCYLQVVALAFLLYGIPGQVFVAPSPLPPSTTVNYGAFMATVHFPIQLFRTLMAIAVAVFTARGVRCMERERQRRMEELRRYRLETQQRLMEQMTERREMQRRLLHQTVQAQEEERRHIARELHDETAQALTALSLGLGAVEEVVEENPELARARLRQLQRLVDEMMKKVNQLSTRLRPTMLDDLGLVPALITYAETSAPHLPFELHVEVTGHQRRLPWEVETNLYRIAQESLTNIARHAQADRAFIHLHLAAGEAILIVSDDGVGMTPNRAHRAAALGEGWGLAGIRERADLLGGSVEIRSQPDAGTTIEVHIPIAQPLSEGGSIA